MKNEEILKGAIRKAIQNGWKPDYMDGKNHPFCILFNHDFTKAFWGTKIESYEVDCISGVFEYYNLPEWQYHLQQMVLEEEPLKYLEKFLK